MTFQRHIEALATPAGHRETRQINALAEIGPNDRPTEDQGLSLFGSNPNAAPESETPAALAGATGADTVESYLRHLDYTLTRLSAARRVLEVLEPLTDDDAEAALEEALDALRAGPPPPPFDGVMAQAESWAGWASQRELKAYALTCFNRMSPADRGAFLGYVQREAA